MAEAPRVAGVGRTDERVMRWSHPLTINHRAGADKRGREERPRGYRKVNLKGPVALTESGMNGCLPHLEARPL